MRLNLEIPLCTRRRHCGTSVVANSFDFLVAPLPERGARGARPFGSRQRNDSGVYGNVCGGHHREHAVKCRWVPLESEDASPAIVGQRPWPRPSSKANRRMAPLFVSVLSPKRGCARQHRRCFHRVRRFPLAPRCSRITSQSIAYFRVISKT